LAFGNVANGWGSKDRPLVADLNDCELRERQHDVALSRWALRYGACIPTDRPNDAFSSVASLALAFIGVIDPLRGGALIAIVPERCACCAGMALRR
jgi:hypothetical protein